VAVRVIPLASGSQGNATLVEMGGVRVLVDAGVSARDLSRRLDAVGIAPESVRFLLLSHEHHDHARGAERFSVRHKVAVCCEPATLEAMNLSPIHLAAWRPLTSARPEDLDGVRVEAFPVPHDAAAPVGFVLEGEGIRVGLVTDIGHATTLVVERLKGCHVLVVESNHDDRMLMSGPYPWALKQRVGGRMGHLSNDEASQLLARVSDDRCRAVVLAHLSEKNNTPALARAAASRALADVGCKRLEMRVAEAKRPTPAVVL
jgi:phosphoribosyl 1,2-cyclic phosphodiesterase